MTSPRSFAARLDAWLFGPAYTLTMRRFRHGAHPGVLAGVAVGLLLVTGLLAWTPFRDPPLLLRAEAVFYGLLVQGGSIALLAIGLGAVSISGDRERQTLQMLTLTPLTAAEFVRGRVLATGVVVLLVGLPAGLPLLVPALTAPPPNAAYLFWEIAGAVVCFVAQAFVFTAAGVYFSATARRSGWAVVSAFTVCGLALLLMLEPPRLFGFPADAGPPLIGSLHPYWAALRGGELGSLFGLPVPLALIAWLGGALCLAVLLAAGAEGVRELRRPAPIALRASLLGLTLLATVLAGADMALIMGVYSIMGVYNQDEALLTLLVVCALFAPMFAAVFATADRNTLRDAMRRAGLAGLFNARQALASRFPASGMTYCLLWMVVMAAGVTLARVTMVPTAPEVFGVMPQHLLILFGWMAALAALGLAASALFRERLVAGTVVVAAGLLTLIVPLVVAGVLSDSGLLLFEMLSPISGMAEAFGPSSAGFNITGLEGGWLLTPMLHFGIAVLLVTGAWVVARRGTTAARH